MNQEVFDTLLDALRKDYKVFTDKFEKTEKENPGLTFEEVNAMVEHSPEKDLSEEHFRLTEEYPVEYELAADTVYMEVALQAMFEDFKEEESGK